MIWYVFGFCLMVVILVIALLNFIRDRRYLRKRTSEVMRREMREEVDTEAEELRHRHDRFREALHDAENKTPEG